MQTIKAGHGTDVLWKPLSPGEMREMQARDGRISAALAFALDDILDAGGIDGLNDLASEKLTGTCLLSEIGYKVVDGDAAGNLVIIEVDGYVDEDELAGLAG